jgi:hypothetical protein
MFERVLAQMSPPAWMAIGLLVVIAGRLLDFTLLILVGAATTLVGIHQLWKAAKAGVNDHT